MARLQAQMPYLCPGDIMAMQGDYVDALYIVAEGLLEVRAAGQGLPLCSIPPPGPQAQACFLFGLLER